MLQHFFLCLLTLVMLAGCQDAPPPPPQRNLTERNVAPPPVVAPGKGKPSRQRRADDSSQSQSKETRSPEMWTANDFTVSNTAPAASVQRGPRADEGRQFAVIRPLQNSQTVSVRVPEDSRRLRNDQLQTNLKMPAGFEIAPESTLSIQGFPTKIRSTRDGAIMCLVDGGVFTRGTNSGPQDASPEHFAVVDPFYMDATEVSVAQYARFKNDVQNAPDKKIPKPADAVNAESGAAMPALGIPFKDAVNFAAYYGKSLPTEAEWERAARGAEGNRYPWGHGRPVLPGESLGTIMNVGSRPTDLTPSGIYDLAGNALEWTTDWYSASAYADSIPKDQSPVRNPEGPKRSDRLGEKAVRGSKSSWELWHRAPANVRGREDMIGFRCILRIDDDMVLSDQPIPTRQANTPPPAQPQQRSGFGF